MAIACLLVPHFALRVALLERPDLDGLPLVLTSPPSNRTVVADCSPEAAAKGIRTGMLLREVTALCPAAEFIHPNPVRDDDAAERITRSLEGFSPLAEMAAPGEWYVDLRGLDRLHGPVDRIGGSLLSFVPPALRPRIGIGPSRFAAMVAARKTTAGGVRIVAADDVSTLLAGVPVAWLQVGDSLPRRFERLGLHTLADIKALPLSAMQARFGQEGKRVWELANGTDTTPVVPRPAIARVTESLSLPAPTTSRDLLLLGLKRLVVRAFAKPELRGRAVRQARLRVMIEGGQSWEKELTLREPYGETRLYEALRLRLQAIELTGQAESLTLDLTGIVGEGARQELLPGMRKRRTAPIIEAARHLKQRYGVSPLFRIAEVEPWSRIPERRHALTRFDP